MTGLVWASGSNRTRLTAGTSSVWSKTLRRRDLIAATASVATLAIVRSPKAARATALEASDGAVSARQIRRAVDGLQAQGNPLSAEDMSAVLHYLEAMRGSPLPALQGILDRYTLMNIRLGAHGLGEASRGGARLALLELGWRSVLVRIDNPFRITGGIMLISPSAIAEGELQPSIHEPHILGSDVAESLRDVPDADTDFERGPEQWLGYRFGGAPASAFLEGLSTEYLILQLYSQSPSAKTAFLAAGSAALAPARIRACVGFYEDFTVRAARDITLNMRDWDGQSTTASFIVLDQADRLYPAPSHRLEPDLGFQPQIYRRSEESLRLPAGRYRVIAQRGPEYLHSEQELIVPDDDAPAEFSLQLQRWIDPPAQGWYPGDPHIHPEGQSFGAVSKLGLTAETIYRQVCGEALSVGSVLIWTGGYYYEKQFLTGHVYQSQPKLPFTQRQQANNVAWTAHASMHDAESLIRYDVEQAAFPSNRLGHPVLLHLQHHDNPFGKSVWDWPSWNLPILSWARTQGCVTGYAHIGHSMGVNPGALPTYEVPPMDGLGINEGLVDITHGLVDFLAGGENAPVVDLSVWYHLLNCGFAIPMLGETDFPAGSLTRRVGTTRTYVGLNAAPHGDAGYFAWCEAIKAGRVYFGDGRSHLIDFEVNGRALGSGVLPFAKPGRVSVSVRVAALLNATPIDPQDEPQAVGYEQWHIERARIGNTRTVPLEVVVNGQVVERHSILADGTLRSIRTHIDLSESSWIALRILPSAHTAPVVVTVEGRSVRASKRSAQWCLDCIELLWSKHAGRIRESEHDAAATAWSHARAMYERIRQESTRP